ncbi:MAG TPA: hypothetical protein VFU34_05040, partial [Gaiellaceae bacterium]|nr:hypothetical protein [Gaiellaceae bacterium]
IADLYDVWNEAIDLEENISPVEAVRRVKRRQERRAERASQRLLQNPDKLLERAPDLKKKLREEDIAQVKAATQRPQRPSSGISAEPGAPRERKRPAVSMAQLDQELSRY